jgi:flagellar basal body rod protein FlgB
MEINHISKNIVNTLDVLSSLQLQIANNIAQINSGSASITRSDFKSIMAAMQRHADTQGSIDKSMLSELVANEEVSIRATKSQMADEVIRSQRIAGKYEMLTELYSKQLGLYKLALGGRN